eukprot:1866599-Ditylum_brightwellii.AAC.1
MPRKLDTPTMRDPMHHQSISSRQLEPLSCKQGGTNCKSGSSILISAYSTAEQEALIEDLFWQNVLEEADKEISRTNIIEQSTPNQSSLQDIEVDTWDDILTSHPSQEQVQQVKSHTLQPKPADCATRMKEVAQDTIIINDLGRDTVRNPGELTILPKANRNTTPLEKPASNYNVVP